jgi:hypothetical protein
MVFNADFVSMQYYYYYYYFKSSTVNAVLKIVEKESGKIERKKKLMI